MLFDYNHGPTLKYEPQPNKSEYQFEDKNTQYDESNYIFEDRNDDKRKIKIVSKPRRRYFIPRYFYDVGNGK